MGSWGVQQHSPRNAYEAVNSEALAFSRSHLKVSSVEFCVSLSVKRLGPFYPKRGPLQGKPWCDCIIWDMQRGWEERPSHQRRSESERLGSCRSFQDDEEKRQLDVLKKWWMQTQRWNQVQQSPTKGWGLWERTHKAPERRICTDVGLGQQGGLQVFHPSTNVESSSACWCLIILSLLWSLRRHNQQRSA